MMSHVVLFSGVTVYVSTHGHMPDGGQVYCTPPVSISEEGNVSPGGENRFSDSKGIGS